MLFGQRSEKRKESIKVLLGKPAELLGDEFALAHILSISFYGSSGAPANVSNFPKYPATDGQEHACFQQLAIICESQFVRWGLSHSVPLSTPAHRILDSTARLGLARIRHIPQVFAVGGLSSV